LFTRFHEENKMKFMPTNARNAARRAREAASYEVRFAASVMQAYRETIARQPPETFALLGARLDDPFTITDFRFCPPRKTNGKYDRSRAHVNVDPDYMNFVVDEEFKPAGKYMAGIWHSHPGGSRSPSIGDESSNEGDMVFFRSCLRNDDSPDRNWKYFIAPITTFAVDGSDNIDVWVVTLDAAEPVRASYSIDAGSPLLMMPKSEKLAASSSDEDLLSSGLSIEAIMGRFNLYQSHISAVANAPAVDPSDREALVECLRRTRQRELDDIAKGLHPLGRYVETPGSSAIGSVPRPNEKAEQQPETANIQKTGFGTLIDHSE
jgi:proteasome lid subunit RPN8/RPN11